MLFKKSALSKLAEMICGDVEYFPYRSSSYLTRFFHEIDIDKTHDGSTRRWWVLGVLDSINKDGSETNSLPANDLIKVIEHLMSPEHFGGNSNVDKNLALQRLNDILKSYQLKVELNSVTDNPRLVSLSENFVSTEIKKTAFIKKITFSPSVFKIPDIEQNNKLVALMMPFSKEFDIVGSSIKAACEDFNLICKRADDLWRNSTVIQDIFDLIYASEIVIADFTGKNPNVMYEIGIAHTLGKVVIPITQSIDDMPFDIKHHRVLKYLNNNEGMLELKRGLSKRLNNIINSDNMAMEDMWQ